MLSALLSSLDSAGYEPHLIAQPEVVHAGPDATLTLRTALGQATFLVEHRPRAPWPGEVASLESIRIDYASKGVPLLAAPYISDGTGKALTSAGWSWADESGRARLLDREMGLDLAWIHPPAKTRGRISLHFPRGGGGLGVVRCLLTRTDDLSRTDDQPNTTGSLAKAAGGVTSQRASQVLHALEDHGLAERSVAGIWRPNLGPLLDAFQDSYQGPRGTRSFYYTTDSLREAAHVIADHAGGERIRISADVAPDLLLGAFQPQKLVVYVHGHEILPRTRFIPTNDEDNANVLVIEPADISVVYVHSRLYLPESKVELVDPAQMIYDLRMLGGDERDAAADRMRTWLLNP